MQLWRQSPAIVGLMELQLMQLANVQELTQQMEGQVRNLCCLGTDAFVLRFFALDSLQYDLFIVVHTGISVLYWVQCMECKLEALYWVTCIRF